MLKAIGELIESIAGRAGLKNVREFGESLSKPGKGPAGDGAGGLIEKLKDVLGSDLLDYGQTVIAGMKNTAGQGDPERGDVFGLAQATFTAVNETLKAAVPANDWDGAGSSAYADQNTRQQLRSEAMTDADHEVHKVLFREAAQITLRRGYLDDQYNFLADTSYVTFPLQFIPRYGEAMKMAIEIGALQTALGESYSPDEPPPVRSGAECRRTTAGGWPILGRGRRCSITRRHSEFRPTPAPTPVTGTRSAASHDPDRTLGAARRVPRHRRLDGRLRCDRPRARQGFRSDEHRGHRVGASADGGRRPGAASAAAAAGVCAVSRGRTRHRGHACGRTTRHDAGPTPLEEGRPVTRR